MRAGQERIEKTHGTGLVMRIGKWKRGQYMSQPSTQYLITKRETIKQKLLWVFLWFQKSLQRTGGRSETPLPEKVYTEGLEEGEPPSETQDRRWGSDCGNPIGKNRGG